MLTKRKHQNLFFGFYIVVAAVLALSQPGYYHWLTDEHYFGTALQHSSLGEFLLHRYLNWTGRMGIELVLVNVINHTLLWRLLNFALLLALMRMMASILMPAPATLPSHSPREGSAILFFMTFLMTPTVAFFACFWETGSMNYLWPTVASVYALRPFYSAQRFHKGEWVTMLLAASYAAYSEQICIVLLPLMLIGLAHQRHRLGTARLLRGHLLVLIAAVINAVILFASPGSLTRFFAEIAYRMPEYGTLGLADRFTLGMQLVATHLHDPLNYVPALTTVLAFVALLARRPTPKQRWLLYAGMFGCVLFFQLTVLTTHVYKHNVLISNSILTAHNQMTPWPYLVIASSGMFYIGLAVLAALALRDDSARFYMAPILIAAAVLSEILLGFSPTVFASGDRVLFLPDLLLAAVDLMLFYKIIQLKARRAAIAAFAPFMLITLFMIAAQVQHGGKNLLGHPDPTKAPGSNASTSAL